MATKYTAKPMGNSMNHRFTTHHDGPQEPHCAKKLMAMRPAACVNANAATSTDMFQG